MKRWIDLTSYGMKLRLAVLPTTRALVLEGGDAHRDQALALGFKRRDSGAWVREAAEVNPREFLRILPNSKVREMPDEEILLKAPQKKDAPVEAGQATPAAAVVSDASGERFLGVNRMGHRIVEENGFRVAVDPKGRRVREDRVSAPVPGFFLRAVDDATLTECVEGYVEHGRRWPEGTTAEDLVRITGAGRLATEKVKAEIAKAAVRSVTRKGVASLRERFGKAVDVHEGIGDASMPDGVPLPFAVAVRRLLGSDQELLGSSVSAPAAVSALLPRGVRQVDAAGPDVSVHFPAPAAETMVDGLGRVPGDVAAAISALSSRKDAARTVFVTADPGERDAVRVAAWLAANHDVEAVTRVADTAAGPRMVAVVGMRREAPSEDAPAVGSIGSYGELWSWASEVAFERTRRIQAVESGLMSPGEFGASDPTLARTTLQTPYSPASKVGAPTTMIPRELEGATRQALEGAMTAYGDLDRKVAIEFGYPEDRMGSFLAPEQVDALALYLHAEDRRRSFLLADSTGVGKGRAIASIAKRSAMRGRRVIVLSEKEENLSDLQRDVVHIGAQDVVRPAVLNDCKLIDETTGRPFETADRDVLLRAVKAGKWPEGISTVYATYSQFNRTGSESERVAWLAEVVGDDVDVILDEVHNAASGDSNVSENLSRVVEAAGSVVFSSATFAATPKMMAFYSRLFPEGTSADEIVAMMKRGGEQFQEVVTAMLAADGVMVRREQDMSKVDFVQLVDGERVARNRDYMDRLAEVISEMAELSGDLDRWVNERNRTEGMKSLQMTRMGFGSPLHNMTRLFEASLLADYAAERAVAALKAGEKPVVLVENTIQGILDDIHASDGDAPDFRAVVHRILTQVTSIKTEDEAQGQALVPMDHVDAGGPIVASVRRIRAMIDELPPLPASAIDQVKERIREAGFTVGEITGRSLEVIGGKVVPRTDRNRIATKNAFNAGEIDSLIFNVSGATGVDMHAGRRFKDRRRRVLVELQAPSQVLRQTQAYGRVNRRDQESAPRIELLASGLPAAARIAAMRNQKLRRLSASVSSNRDSAYLTRNIPDLINSVGDVVITRYAQMRPDLMRKLCLLDEEVDDAPDAVNAVPQEQAKKDEVAKEDHEYSANVFLARLMLLPTATQEKILAEVVAEYTAHLQELEAKGENPLRPREMDGIVHHRASRVFEGAVSGGGDTVFDAPLVISEVMVERIADPIRADAVVERVEAGAASLASVAAAVHRLEHGLETLIEPFLPAKAKTLGDALRMNDKSAARMVSDARDIRVAVAELSPGREVQLSWTGEAVPAVVTGVEPAPKGYEHLPHMWAVTLAIPGETKFVVARLSSLIIDPAFMSRDERGVPSATSTDGLDGDGYDDVLERFEKAVATRMTPARILTSNVFRAVRLATEHKLGKLVSYVDADGVRTRGVLVRKDFERKLDLLALRIDGKTAAMGALVELRAEISTSPTATEKGVLISPLSDAEWRVRLPARPRRPSGMWLNEAVNALAEGGDKDNKGRTSIMVSGVQQLDELMSILEEAGITAFYASSKHRRTAGWSEEETARRRVA